MGRAVRQLPHRSHTEMGHNLLSQRLRRFKARQYCLDEGAASRLNNFLISPSSKSSQCPICPCTIFILISLIFLAAASYEMHIGHLTEPAATFPRAFRKSPGENLYIKRPHLVYMGL
jgi:hypothetical protein